MPHSTESLPAKRYAAMIRRLLSRVLRPVSGAPAYATRPAPTARNLPSLRGRLEIVRDRRGVPHIYAACEPDAYAALGFIQAADRFALLDVLRHLGAGRMTQLFGDLRAPRSVELVGGKSVRDVDQFLRPLGLEAQSEAGYQRLDERGRACLDAFADGANAALRAMQGVYPDEYVFLGAIEPWRPYDCLLNASACALVVGLGAIEFELTLDAVRGHVGDTVAREIFPDLPWNDVPTSYRACDGPTPEPGLHHVGGGSNNWVVDASRSAQGAPILANDPHVPVIPLPTFWTHAHVETAGYRVQGGMFPGCPSFGYGHNGNLAWGCTTVFRDAWDVYRVHRLPEDKSRYRTVDGTGEIRRHVETGYARFGRSARLEWESCEHGILYPGWKHHDGVDLAVRYAPADLGAYFQGSLALMESKSVDEHRAALRLLNEGPFDFNHVYAHKDGHIAWEPYGHLPRRARDGAFVRDAHDPEAQWRGFLDFDEMPKIVAPECGFVATANGMTDPSQNAVIATPEHYEPRLRQERIEHRLAARRDHDVASFRSLQADVQATYAPAIRDALLALLEQVPAGEDELREALQVLRDWDAQFTVGSAGAGLFYLTLVELTQSAFRALLGPEVGARYATGRKARPRLHQLLVDPADPLRPRIERAAGRGLHFLAAEAFASAASQMRQVSGAAPQLWRWGDLQRAWLGTMLAVLPGFGRGFVVLDAPYPGDVYTVHPSISVPVGKRWISLVGPSSRFICDLARPDEAWFAHSSGPSGDPRSQYFANLSQSWVDGEYFLSGLWPADAVPDVVEHYVAGSPG